MKRTLYIRKADEAIWEQANAMFGDKLAPIISQTLKAAIEEHKLEFESMTRALPAKWRVRLEVAE